MKKVNFNPFWSGIAGSKTQTIDADGRIRKVKEFTEDECRRALLLPGLQKTVIAALQRRLRALQTK